MTYGSLIATLRGLIVVVLACGVPRAAHAQTGAWEAFRDEYQCHWVTRTTATQVTRLGFDRLGYSLSIAMRTRPDGFIPVRAQFAQIELPSGSRPALTYRATTHRTGRTEAWGDWEETPELILSGGADFLDWAQRGRSFGYVVFSNRYTLFVEDLAGARAVLNACTPLVPPPNRAVRPQGRVANWLDTDALSRLAAGGAVAPGSAFGPLVANLIINARGRVQSCTITPASGIAALDTALCQQLTRRGNFQAATDALGKHIASNYALSIGKLQF